MAEKGQPLEVRSTSGPMGLKREITFLASVKVLEDLVHMIDVRLLVGWWNEFAWSLKTHEFVSKLIPKSPILWFNHEWTNIIMSEGWIQGGLGEFFRCSWNSIKSDDKLYR